MDMSVYNQWVYIIMWFLKQFNIHHVAVAINYKKSKLKKKR